MARRKCPNCGSRLPPRSRFCPECGTRVAEGDTAVEPLPPDETGPVPVHVARARPRAFELLEGAARGSAVALGRLRSRARFGLEAVATRSTARRDLLRLRNERAALLAARDAAVRELGEAVYRGDGEATETQRRRVEELDGQIAEKEAEMTDTAASAVERIEQAHLEVEPTAVETPEPYPPPAEPPSPTTVPEPTPVPSEPPGPVPVPEPGPEPSPPPMPPQPGPGPEPPQTE